MPVNPLYQFIEPGAGDIEGRNQVLNFLQQDAQRTGMPLNYQREIGNAQEQMNVMEQARPQLNMGPAPQQMAPRPRPQAPMPRPQMSQPLPAVPQGGLVPPVEIDNQPPQSLPVVESPQLPKAEFSISPKPQPQLPPRAMETTMARKIQEGGYDPRLMYAALAQFAGEFGNLGGRATPSSAPQFLEAQLALEKQQRDEAFRQQREEESQRLRQQEMELRYAPKPEDATQKLKYEMIKNQSDSIKSRAQVEQELNDPNSSRTRALKQAYQQATGQTLPDGLSGKDVYQIMPMTTRGIEAQKSREFQAQQGVLNREAAALRQDTALAAKQTGASEMPGEPITQVPGWKKVENVPVEKTELQQFRRRTAAVPRVVQKINQLKNLIAKFGPYENEYSAAGQQMMSLANDIKLDLKGPEFKALGVLAGPDMAILEALIPDTSSFKNMAKSSSSVNASLDSLAKRLEEDLDASGTSIGFSRVQQQQQPAVGPRGKPLWKP